MSPTHRLSGVITVVVTLAALFALVVQPLPVDAQPPEGLRFTLIRMNAGDVVGNLVYADPPDDATGAGNIDDIVRAVVDEWAKHIHDDVHITLRYGWHAKPEGNNNLGGAGPTTISSDGREIEAMLFLNRTFPNWWLDPTPNEASEFGPVDEFYTDLGAGELLTHRRATAPLGSPARSRYDAVQVALHEVGHVVGFSWNYPDYFALTGESVDNSYQGTLTVAPALPFGGSSVATSYGHISLGGPVMAINGSTSSMRRWLTDLDLLGAATLAGYDTVTLPSVEAPSGPESPGDVNCDSDTTITDALSIAQYTVGGRVQVSACPLGDPAAELVAAWGDVNGDASTDVLDALLIAQCEVGQLNVFCSE